MRCDTTKIVYTPSDNTVNYYLGERPQPQIGYIISEYYNKVVVAHLVPNKIIFVNDKPWYETKSVTTHKPIKEVEKLPYWNWKATCKIEDVWFCDKNIKYNIHDKNIIAELLEQDVLVLSEDKYITPWTNTHMKKDGKDYIITTEFTNHDNDWYKHTVEHSREWNANEVFQTYNECVKYIKYQTWFYNMRNSVDDITYSLQEACRYLKNKGYSPEDRKKYLEAFDKILQDNPINELFVRDGKVWYGCKSEQPDVETPEPPENINRSMKVLREYNEQCSYITNCINWYNHHKELVLNNG